MLTVIISVVFATRCHSCQLFRNQKVNFSKSSVVKSGLLTELSNQDSRDKKNLSQQPFPIIRIPIHLAGTKENQRKMKHLEKKVNIP